MSITVACPCGKKLQVKDAAAGMVVACPGCRAHVRVPAAAKVPTEDRPPGADAILPSPPSNRKPAPAPKKQNAVANGRRQAEGLKVVPDAGVPIFFQPPPEVVGKIAMSFTSSVEGSKKWSIRKRLVWSAVISAVILGLLSGYFKLTMSDKIRDTGPGLYLVVAVLAVVLFLLIFAITSLATGFSHLCGYIGDKGAAYFECKKTQGNITLAQAFSFEQADQLHIFMLHLLTNGVYHSTDYEFTWTNSRKKTVFLLKGKHRYYQQIPAPTPEGYSFAVEAEKHWSLYLLQKILKIINAGDSYSFAVQGSGLVTVDRDSLEFRSDGERRKFLANDMEKMVIKNGVFKLKESDAEEGWFSSTGVHSIPLNSMANSRTFRLLMAKLFKVEVDSD